MNHLVYLLMIKILIKVSNYFFHERLTVPHMGVLERDFVLLPLLDLDLNLQINGLKIKDTDVVKQSELTVLADESWVNI